MFGRDSSNKTKQNKNTLILVLEGLTSSSPQIIARQVFKACTIVDEPTSTARSY